MMGVGWIDIEVGCWEAGQEEVGLEKRRSVRVCSWRAKGAEAEGEETKQTDS